MSDTIIIVGAGISGLGAAYSLRERGIKCIILEQSPTYGGLCGNFTIADGFRFDRFVHFSFTDNFEVNKIFKSSTEGHILSHIPNPYNIYHRQWIKHPAQNNLFPLSEEEKKEIIADFKSRPKDISPDNILNYEEWLRIQYGNSFAERFPMTYTPKYWMCEAKDLEIKWIGQRLYQPSIEEVIQGAYTSDTPITYYAKEMRYPEKGGYKAFLNELVKDADIRYNEEVVRIDTNSRIVTTKTGTEYEYSRLISSMPLPDLVKALEPSPPKKIIEAANKLRYTSGYLISIALKGNNIPPFLWWYIYDKDILPARVYSPTLKSKDNAPEGCSSLQLEVYCKEKDYSDDELIAKSVEPLIAMGIIRREDIITIDIRFEPWANIVFDHHIYQARETVLQYIRSVGIEPIGRFGLWEYLWSDQALISGLSVGK